MSEQVLSSGRAFGEEEEETFSEVSEAPEDEKDLFASIRHLQNSKLPNHQLVVSVLAGIEETARSQEGEAAGRISPTWYFVTLVSLLEATSPSSQQATAILQMLTIVLPEVPQAVLRSTCPRFLAILKNVLSSSHAGLGQEDQDEEEEEESGAESSAATLRYTFACLAHLLSSQSFAAWQNASLQHFCASLAPILLDHRPKPRKAGSEALRRILLNPPSPAVIHPAAAAFARFLGAHLDVPQSKEEEKQCILNLSFLRLVWTAFAPADRFVLMGKVLTILTRCQHVQHIMLQAHYTLTAFAQNTTADETPRDAFTSLAQALSSLKLPLHDPSLYQAHTASLSTVFAKWSEFYPAEAAVHIAPVMATLLPILKNKKKAMSDVTSLALQAILENLPQPMPADDLTAVVDEMANGFSYQYSHVHDHVLEMMARLFTRVGAEAPEKLTSLLEGMDALRANPDFSFKSQLDAAFAAAMASLHAREFLNVLPFHLVPAKGETANKSDAQGRGWILSLIAQAAQGDQLEVFFTEILPIIEHFKQLATAFKTQKRDIDARVCETVEEQAWATLPSLCRQCSDFAAFGPKMMHLITAKVIQRNSKEWASCMKALQELFKADDPYLAQSSQQILPKLMDMYLEMNYTTARGKSQHQIILNTMEQILRTVPEEQCMVYIDKLATQCESVLGAAVRLPAQEEALQASLSLIAHFCANVPVLTDSSSRLIAFLLQHLADGDGAVQKRLYRILVTLTAPKNQALPSAFVVGITEGVIAVQQTVAHPAKSPRLLLLLQLVPQLEASHFYLVQHIIPEAMLGVKEIASEARETSFELLRTIARQILALPDAYFVVDVDHQEDEAMEETSATTQKKATMTEYIYLLMAGLAGKTPHMQSASVRSLTLIIHAFPKAITEEVQQTLLETVLVLLQSRNREVVKATLGATKTLITRFAPALIEAHLKSLVEHVIQWRKEHKQFFQMDVKYTMEKLLHRFGADKIRAFCPEEDQKYLNDMIKQKAKAANKTKGNASQKGPSEEDRMALDLPHVDLQRSAKNARRGGMQIQERSDAPVDLMSKRDLLGPAPQRAASTAASQEPDVYKDGKLYFEEEEKVTRPVKQQAAVAKKMGANLGDLYKEALTGEASFNRDGKKIKFNKRSRDQAEEDDEEMEDGPKKAKKGNKSFNKGKKGPAVEPYAYVPMDPKSMTKKRHAGGVKKQADKGANSMKNILSKKHKRR